MAHKKAGSTAKTNRDSIAKRLGVKRYGGQMVAVGNIIIRQRGTHFSAGPGTRLGNDHTIYAGTPGVVKFSQKRGRQFVEVNG